jgi:hypothetical protein
LNKKNSWPLFFAVTEEATLLLGTRKKDLRALKAIKRMIRAKRSLPRMERFSYPGEKSCIPENPLSEADQTLLNHSKRVARR